MSSRLQGIVRRSVAGAAALALAGTLFAGTPATDLAAADPALTVQEAKARVVQLETEAAAIDQQYTEVNTQLEAGRAKLRTKQTDVQAQTAQVARVRLQVGQVALAQFQNRNLETAAQLFLTEETDDFLSQISTVEKVSENQNTVLQDYQAEQAKLAALSRSAASDLALLERQENELGALSAASDKKIAESKAVLARLTAEERARIAAEEKRLLAQARAAAQQAAAAEAAKAASDQRVPGAAGAPPATSGTTSSSKGQTALAFAKSQIGKPYGRNGSGPGSYDCSGLTSAAWRAAGVSLPRTASQQFSVGRSVSLSELQPGDLVFFYPPAISHVGLYAGGGQLIQSPRPGRSVEYTQVSYMPVAGARRPG